MASCATEKLVDRRPRPRKVASASARVRFMVPLLISDAPPAVRWRTRKKRYRLSRTCLVKCEGPESHYVRMVRGGEAMPAHALDACRARTRAPECYPAVGLPACRSALTPRWDTRPAGFSLCRCALAG